MTVASKCRVDVPAGYSEWQAKCMIAACREIDAELVPEKFLELLRLRIRALLRELRVREFENSRIEKIEKANLRHEIRTSHKMPLN